MNYLTWCLTPNATLFHAAPVVIYAWLVLAFAVTWSW